MQNRMQRVKNKREREREKSPACPRCDQSVEKLLIIIMRMRMRKRERKREREDAGSTHESIAISEREGANLGCVCLLVRSPSFKIESLSKINWLLLR